MANNVIQHKRSSIPARIPTANSLAVGELAINLADKKIYTKDGNGNVQQLNTAEDDVIALVVALG